MTTLNLSIDLLGYTVRDGLGRIYATTDSYTEAAEWARKTVQLSTFPQVLVIVNEDKVGASSWKAGIVRTITDGGVES